MARKTGVKITLSIGDDSAILTAPAGRELLVTTDLSVEGVHFRHGWHPPESVGHRCLVRGLSDIAAMGGEPMAAFLSLAIPAELPQRWVDLFLRGFLKLATTHGVALAGGDISQSKSGVVADVIVVGSTPKKTAVRRSGAQAGDVIYVTGSLGESAAGLARMTRAKFHVSPARVKRHLFPVPRLEVAQWLRARKLPTAMIDISDGLSTDLAHICEESRLGATLNEPMIPIAQGATLAQALHGGEDYELLFTAQPSTQVPVEIAGVSVTEIGWMTREKQLLITDLKSKARRLRTGGWQYFAK